MIDTRQVRPRQVVVLSLIALIEGAIVTGVISHQYNEAKIRSILNTNGNQYERNGHRS